MDWMQVQGDREEAKTLRFLPQDSEMDGGAINWMVKPKVGAGLTCSFVFPFQGRKKSKDWYKNLDNDSGLRQWAVVDKGVIEVPMGMMLMKR